MFAVRTVIHKIWDNSKESENRTILSAGLETGANVSLIGGGGDWNYHLLCWDKEHKNRLLLGACTCWYTDEQKGRCWCKVGCNKKNGATFGKAVPHADMKIIIKEAIRRWWQNNWLCVDQEISCNISDWDSSYNKNSEKKIPPPHNRIWHTSISHSRLMQGQTILECGRCRKLITVKCVMLEYRKLAVNCNNYYNNLFLSSMLADNSSVAEIFVLLQEMAIFENMSFWIHSKTDITNRTEHKYKFIQATVNTWTFATKLLCHHFPSLLLIPIFSLSVGWKPYIVIPFLPCFTMITVTFPKVDIIS